jgi:hypothetical protein
MKYAVELGSGAVIRIHTKFHKVWFRYSKVNREGYRDTQTVRRSPKPTFIFQNKESRLKTNTFSRVCVTVDGVCIGE